MKLRILATVMLVVTIFAVYLAAPANAENSKDVNKLLGNNSCFWCDLSGADLKATILTGATMPDGKTHE